ncbi:MAG: hypothetical protein AB1635_06815 [Acidobacteriota bacterium]
MPAVLGRLARPTVVAAAVLAAASCGQVARTGRSPAFLIIDSLQAASGATPSQFGGTLNSDVITLVEQTVNGQQVRVPTVFNDLGRAALRLGLKDPGTSSNPNSPSPLNEITVNRYRVQFRRADGRNTAGVDVPYGFDGAVTATIGTGTAVTVGFELVRHQMKQEPPLRNLQNAGGANIISTICEVTFYGRDQAGNEVTVVGTISVNFGDFGDPQ